MNGERKGAYNKGQDDLSRTGCQAGWINEPAMCKWYAERDVVKKVWEQMTPKQRKQAEISRSLAKQHEAWRATSSAGQEEVPAVGASRPLPTLAASSLRAAGPKGSLSTQVVVSQAASSVVFPTDSLASGPLAPALPEV